MLQPRPNHSPEEDLHHLDIRLQELNNSSTQVLIFLSFAIVAAVTYLATSLAPSQKLAVHSALHWWIGAIFPTVWGIVPLKEIKDLDVRWFRFLLWVRFLLLWTAISCIVIGAIQFFRSV